MASTLGFPLGLIYSLPMDDLQKLAEIVERVAHALTFDEAAETLTDWARELTGCDTASSGSCSPRGGPANGSPLLSIGA